MRHTKGPWKLEYDDAFGEDGEHLGLQWNSNIVGPEYVQESFGEKHTVRDVVCVLGFSAHNSHLANAHLIAAAPELYEALKFAKEVLDDQVARFHKDCRCQLCESLMMLIESSMAKAEGK